MRIFIFLLFNIGLYASGDRSCLEDLYHSVRPNIATIKRVDTSETDVINHTKMRSLFLGMQSFLAQIRGISKDEVLVFIARDSEYLYDLLKILDPEAKTILINISTPMVRSLQQKGDQGKKLLLEYLKQKGVLHALENGGVRFVDTGVLGSIITALKKILKETTDLPVNHLVSGHLIHAQAYDSGLSDIDPLNLDPLILKTLYPSSTLFNVVSGVSVGHLERLPKYTNHGTHFTRLEDGSLDVGSSSSGVKESRPDFGASFMDKERALKILSMIKSYGSESSTQKKFQKSLDLMRSFAHHIYTQTHLSSARVQFFQSEFDRLGLDFSYVASDYLTAFIHGSFKSENGLNFDLEIWKSMGGLDFPISSEIETFGDLTHKGVAMLYPGTFLSNLSIEHDEEILLELIESNSVELIRAVAGIMFRDTQSITTNNKVLIELVKAGYGNKLILELLIGPNIHLFLNDSKLREVLKTYIQAGHFIHFTRFGERDASKEIENNSNLFRLMELLERSAAKTDDLVALIKNTEYVIYFNVFDEQSWSKTRSCTNCNLREVKEILAKMG